MNISANTHIGMKRSQNQDAFASGELSQSLAWAVVCDGMGGPAGGGIASEIAVSAVASGMNLHSEISQFEIEKNIGQVINSANARIFEMSEALPQYKGMGTTLVMCVVKDKTLTVAHAGDSRAYLIRRGEIIQLTTDHSLVQNMVESGEISADEATHHPQKNIITRALGVTAELEYDCCAHTLEEEDIILLCTDGLTNMCEDELILQLAKQSPLANLPDALIALANERGGLDNITVLVMGA
ncbi:MAG: Stp1/IreP family PP2C-type Ser/Thr phosphatase [Oscillospiraceae bacterium]|nr:Stp1/IreP family PP2C-type Ser/Thr phosphatase [Oscillospiraceae bacterium]